MASARTLLAVPNFSEGRDPDVIDAIAAALTGACGDAPGPAATADAVGGSRATASH